MKKKDYGYFARPKTKRPLRFQVVSIDHLPGLPLRGIWRFIFFWVLVPQYRVHHKIIYITKEGDEIEVPSGFTFNGGSVPFTLWWLYPPDQPTCLPAFCVHDWLCSPPFPYDSVRSHVILHDACRANGASPLKAYLIWLAVRLFGPRFKGD